MVSIIICSKKPALLKKMSDNVSATVGIPYEIISIANPNGEIGICEAYNIGAAQAKFNYLCFCHEDITFHTQNWGQIVIDNLLDEQVGIIGVVGCNVMPKAPSGPWIESCPVNRVNMLQGVRNGPPYLKNENPLSEEISEVVVLDGLWMCCRKNVWLENKFDQKLLKGFHGYDIDFSLQIKMRFKLYVIYTVLIEHDSDGIYESSWILAQSKVAEKWKNSLPMAIDGDKKYIYDTTLSSYFKILKIAVATSNYSLYLRYFLKSISIIKLKNMDHLIKCIGLLKNKDILRSIYLNAGSKKN